MEDAPTKTERFIKNMRPSSSYLFIGVSSEEESGILDNIVKTHSVLKQDIVEIAPEIKKGNQKIYPVESVRNFLHKINLTPVGKTRLAVIREAEKLKVEASNTLLKTLEEPPKNLILVLFSESDNLLLTLKSRCIIIRQWAIQNSSNIEIELLKKPFYAQVKEIDKIVKEGETLKFISDLEHYARNRLVKFLDPGSVDILKEVLSTKTKIIKNGNAKIQLENLILKLK